MADYGYISATGTVFPDTGDILAQVQAEWRAAFGQDLIVTPDTPQGVIITLQTLARDALVRNNAALANQINPNLAGGIWLDAIWALTGGARVVATRSIVREVVVAGVPGALIPQGSQARVGEAGALFETTGAVTLNSLGQGLATFRSVEFGPIGAAADALDTIVTPVLGWETVNNPTPAEPGTVTESDEASRARRRVTLGAQGVALPDAILAGVWNVADVTSVVFRENVTDAPLVIEDQTLDPHSIYVCVDGGLDSEIGAALLAKKSLGAGWNGTTTVAVTDAASGQVYGVSFQRPDAIPIFAAVDVKVLGPGGDPAAEVRAAIVAYANGEQEGEAGLTIGQDVSAFEFAGAVNRAAPELYVSNVRIGLAPGTLATTPIAITISERAQVIAGNIVVNVT